MQTPESWLGPERSSSPSHDADSSASIFSLIDGRNNVKPTAHLLEAFVAALEVLQPSDNGVHNPLAPKKPPVLARHLLHICLDSSDVTFDLTSPPFFNADAANDRAAVPGIGSKFARLGVSITSCAVKPTTSEEPSAQTSREAQAAILGFHKIVAEPNKLVNEDLAAMMSEAVREKVKQDANVVSSGLTPNSVSKGATAANAGVTSTKRGREDEVDATSGSVKRSKSGSISQSQPPLPNSSASQAPPTSTAPSAQIKLDPSVSTKVMFLRSQQENMVKNWALAYSAVVKSESSGENLSTKAPGMNKAYLEQLKAQLLTQQHALKMLVGRIVSGAETAPNFNVSLQSLINIDKEAREMGVNLGGPSGGGAGGGGARAGRSGSVTGGQQPPAASLQGPTNVVKPTPASNDPAASTSTNNNSTTSAAQQPPPSPTRPKPFWRGTLTWSVISDPTTKQKRDVATLVSATSNSPLLDRLLMPWPDKLQITAITQLSPRNLQVYAQSQNAPYILFSTQEADANGSGSSVLTPATAEKNRQMYSSLAGSLDAKKSCAFIRHGSNAGAGLVLFATTQPTSSAERKGQAGGGAGQAKLIGVVLKDTIPFSRLLSGQSSTTSATTAAAGNVKVEQEQRARSTSASQPEHLQQQQHSQPTQQIQQPQQAPQPQPQPPQQPTGMGLGSSMPFNLAALNAAGNVPVSGLGASAGLGAGMNLSSLLPPTQNNLANFNLAQFSAQPQDAFSAGTQQQQPNLAALAQLLGIGGQNVTQQQPQQQMGQQQHQAFGQGLSQNIFGQLASSAPPQQQQQQPVMFDNLNPFGVANQQQQPQQQQQQQQVQVQQQAEAAGGAGGDGSAGQMDFSKPMTMDQLRALGFIS